MAKEKAGSQLAGLKARRAKAVEKKILRITVPDYDPPLVVKCRPVSQDEIDKAGKALKPKSGVKKSEATLDANAQLLIDACVGIEALDADGEVEETWEGFDEELAKSLELDDNEPKTARYVCRKAFIFDGPLISAAEKLARWSGYRNEEVDEEFAGE